MKRIVVLTMAFVLMLTAACNRNENRTAADRDNAGAGANTTAANTNIGDRIDESLRQANLGDVRAEVDNEKRVVRLGGEVKSDADKVRAEQIAKANAGDYVVANELGIRPEGEAGDIAKKVDTRTDDAIKAEWKAMEARMRLDKQNIDADVKNGVLTLKGDVDNDSMRSKVEQAASKIPHVQQVVNELQVKSAAH
ncbi:MAG TPA: BON domain-containing protein [Clostridia bacterium]|nr:BON domain-containing protein [Clostridia bacterium]